MSEKESTETGASKTGAPAAARMMGGHSLTRRSLLVGGVATAALFAMGGAALSGGDPLVRPPGGQDEVRLAATCIRCQKCYEACPRRVIVPAHLEDGLASFRTPMLSFAENYCDFCAEENGGVPLCVATCPTEALALSPGVAPEATVLGVAAINSHDCLAYRNTGCRFCYDACPYGAIEMTEGGKNARPVVVGAKCNGCGACESVCVSLESGSIAGGATARAIVVVPLGTAEGRG